MVINNNGVYYHAAWADDTEGTNFSLTEYPGAVYVGNYSDSSSAESANYQDYTWQVVGEVIVPEDNIEDDTEALEDVVVSDLADTVESIEDDTTVLAGDIQENDENLQETQGTSDEGLGNLNELVGTNQGTSGWTASAGITLSEVTGTIYDENEDAVKYVVATCTTAGTNYIYFACNELRDVLETLTDTNSYTFSADVKMSTIFEIPTIAVQDTDGTNTQIAFDPIDNEPNTDLEDYDNDGAWIFNRSTAEAENEVSVSDQVLFFDLSNMAASDTVAIANLKIEGGALATPWRASLQEVEQTANTALSNANSALTTAGNAYTLAEGVNEHFWYDSAGAHVTEDTQEDYQQDPSLAGGNTLITSSGMAIRQGTQQLAAFTSTGAQIGQNENGQSRTTIGTAGMQIYQKDSGGTDVAIANLGYGAGIDDQGTTSDAPFYTLGIRAASTVGNYSTAEGFNNIASGYASHSEGDHTEATAKYTHAEGIFSKATHTGAHAEGVAGTTASGYGAHAQNYFTTASGRASHAGGTGTVAQRESQTAIGDYNALDTTGTTQTHGDYAFIIGNGTDDNNRSNALTVDWSGSVDAAGGYKVNGTALPNLFYVDTGGFTFNPKSAGANGYVTIPTLNLLPAGATVVSMSCFTGNIANSNGAQFSPISYSNSAGCYVNYYCPRAINGAVSIHVTIIYTV